MEKNDIYNKIYQFLSKICPDIKEVKNLGEDILLRDDGFLEEVESREQGTFIISSLQAIEVIVMIENYYEIRIEQEDVIAFNTIGDLVRIVEKEVTKKNGV